MSAFVQESVKIGVDLNNPASGPGPTSGATTSTIGGFTLMDTCFGTQNTEWVYVYCSGGFNTGSGVSISQTGTASLWTPTTVGAGTGILAFAQTSFTDGQYGWVARRGNFLNVLVSATSTLQVQLYASATSGALTTTSTSGSLAGISLQTASTTAVIANNLAVVNWPRSVIAGGL